MARLEFPPGGPFNVSGQSLANQHLYNQLMGGARSGGGRRRRRPKAAMPGKRRRAAKAARPARLVKGSAAAKRYMASIRRKRRK